MRTRLGHGGLRRAVEFKLLSSQPTGYTRRVWFARSCRVEVSRNLVDPASSHMLVSKIKPCMSQYKLLYGETANGSLKQL